MSCKGLTKQGKGSYTETIEGWTCDYSTQLRGGAHWKVYRSKPGKNNIAHGWTFGRGSLGAARAAARAVVMEREARGLEVDTARTQHDQLVLWDDWATYYQHDTHWTWEIDGRPSPWGTAPTLAEARKAAREAGDAGP